MKIVFNNQAIFDWRVALCVSLVHLAFFLGSSFSFDFLKQEKPLEIAIEISGVTSVVAGATEARQAVQGDVVPKDKKSVTPEVKKNKPKTSEESVLSEPAQAPSSSATSSQPAVQAGGMEAAPQVRPDVSARVTKSPKPIYPKKAFEDGVEGTVLLNVEVLETGHTGRVVLAKSSGVSILDISAMEAVKLWQFAPAKAGGRVVKQWVQIPIKFSLAR
jgi:TonB family protein